MDFIYLKLRILKIHNSFITNLFLNIKYYANTSQIIFKLKILILFMKTLTAFILFLIVIFPISCEFSTLIVPLNDSDIPKEIKPLLKEGYRIYFQDFEENLIEFICYDENSASLLLGEFINSRGGYKLQEYSPYSYRNIDGYYFTTTWGAGYVLKDNNKIYVFNSPSNNIKNLNILIENKFGKEYPYHFLILLLVPIGVILYKLFK